MFRILILVVCGIGYSQITVAGEKLSPITEMGFVGVGSGTENTVQIEGTNQVNESYFEYTPFSLKYSEENQLSINGVAWVLSNISAFTFSCCENDFLSIDRRGLFASILISPMILSNFGFFIPLPNSQVYIRHSTDFYLTENWVKPRIEAGTRLYLSRIGIDLKSSLNWLQKDVEYSAQIVLGKF